jgi:nucleoid-associated protein YgaU
MNGDTRDRVRLRSAALGCTTTAGATGVGWLTLPAISAAPTALRSGDGFADVLVAACAAAAVVAAAWLWAITTDVVADVLRTGGRVAVRRPGPLRLVLLSACGAVVLSATAVPASADDSRPLAPHSLSGLPLPDRATSDVPPLHDAARTPTEVTVRPGDSLWSIAERHLGPSATVGYWHRIYDRNAAVIGPDPDLILPGQRLELPPTG